MGTIQAREEILEYTDAPPAEPMPNETQMPQARPATPLAPSEGAEGKASDLVAMLLSVVPGLGHIYKGHKADWHPLDFGSASRRRSVRAGRDSHGRLRARADGFLLVRRRFPRLCDFRSRDARDQGRGRAILICLVRQRQSSLLRRSLRGFPASRSGISTSDNAPEICAHR